MRLLLLWDAVSFEHRATITEHTTGFSSIAFGLDSQTLVSGSWDRAVRLWDTTTGNNRTTLTGHIGPIESVAFSADGQTVASSGGITVINGWFVDDYTIRLWDAATGTHKTTLFGHKDRVFDVVFSPDGRMLASCGEDKNVCLWDTATGNHLATLAGHKGGVYNITFSPDGKTLASSGRGEIYLWDVANRQQKLSLTGYVGAPWDLAFSPDGQTLASGGTDSDVHLWDVATGEHKITLTGHTDRITSVAFSPDGKTLASSGGWKDRTVRLWDPMRGELKSTLTVYADTVQSVAFSPDGNTLATAGAGGVVLLWHLGPTVASPPLEVDVNGDGVEDVHDLVLVAANFGQMGPNAADVNGDGIVDAADLIKVAAALDNVAAAPSAAIFNVKNVQQWLTQAQQLDLTDATLQRGIHFLEQLLRTLAPTETVLLPNYPNPFNPETWIPYQLAEAANVTLRIYSADGKLVRTLALGHQSAGIYQNRSRAAYWDGKNEFGEPVASSVYFYNLTAGDFAATRKMLIQK